MKCKNCNYVATCSCNFNEGYCWTCFYNKSNNFENKKIESKICNYDKQTLEKLLIQKQKEQNNNLTKFQISVIKSQLNIFNKNPCKYSLIIDKILVN